MRAENKGEFEYVEVWGDGKIVRDYIFIDDICNAVFLLIKNNEWNNIFNIGSGKGTSINTVIKIIKKVTKINFRVDYLEGRKIDVPFNILNISKLKSAIKFTETSLTDGIQKTLTWLKNNNNA